MLESDHGRLVKFCCKYVDDIFCLFENEHHSLTFLDFLNIQYQNLNFIIEKEHMKQLPFLDGFKICSDRLITVSIGKVHSQEFYRIKIALYHLHTRKVSLKLWLNELFVSVTHGMVST